MASAKVIPFLAPVGTSATDRPARASATSPASGSTSTSSWAATALSSTPAFTGEYQPDKLHRYLAELPASQRAGGFAAPCQLIATTNYGDALERAFPVVRVPLTSSPTPPRTTSPVGFIHLCADGASKPIPGTPTTAAGEVDSGDDSEDGYVITEDHHVDYLAKARRSGSWAIESRPDPIDERFWERHRIEIVTARLEDRVDAMLRTP